MSTRIYEIVVTAAAEKNFLKTAEIHNLSPSAISHSIKKLENKLGIAIFHRSRTGVKLTQNGKLLLPYLKDAIDSEERLKQAAAEVVGVHRGIVRLGIFRSIMIEWGPQLISSFRSLYPGIDLRIIQGGYPEINEEMRRGNVDLAFLSLGTADKGCRLDYLHKDCLVCLVPKEYKTINPDYITMDELHGQQLISQRSGEDVEQKNLLARHGLRFSTKFYITDDDAIGAMVESGFGMAIMPEIAANNIVRNVSMYRIEPAEYRTICLASSNSENNAPATQRLRKHIIGYIHENNLYNV